MLEILGNLRDYTRTSLPYHNLLGAEVDGGFGSTRLFFFFFEQKNNTHSGGEKKRKCARVLHYTCSLPTCYCSAFPTKRKIKKMKSGKNGKMKEKKNRTTITKKTKKRKHDDEKDGKRKKIENEKKNEKEMGIK